MKKAIIILLLGIHFSVSNAQELNLVKLTAQDKKIGLFGKYEYDAVGSYGEIRLQLFRNGSYKYWQSTFNRDQVSHGTWSQSGNVLTLQSSIEMNNLPIKLLYKTDTIGSMNGFIIGIVRNLRGEFMTDGLVYINNDSILCSPMMSLCVPPYTSIDSIKIKFENGISSKWIRIEKRDFKQIVPVVQTDFLISPYMVFDKEKYLMQKSKLKPIN